MFVVNHGDPGLDTRVLHTSLATELHDGFSTGY